MELAPSHISMHALPQGFRMHIRAVQVDQCLAGDFVGMSRAANFHGDVILRDSCDSRVRPEGMGGTGAHDKEAQNGDADEEVFHGRWEFGGHQITPFISGF
jgi:hypothetical protein